MGELISREAALRDIAAASQKYEFETRDILAGLYEADAIIRELPAIDPVRRASWVKDKDGNWICTGCGHPAIPHPILHETHQCTTDYCPKCGAKMDGGEQR